MFIVTVTYVADLDQVDALIPAHREWLDGHYAAGRFVASGPQVPRTGGLIIARGDRDELDSILATDPFSLAGVATYAVIEFTPVKTAPEFAGLAEA